MPNPVGMRRRTTVGSDVSWNWAEAGLGEQRTGRTWWLAGGKGEARMEAGSACGRHESGRGCGWKAGSGQRSPHQPWNATWTGGTGPSRRVAHVGVFCSLVDTFPRPSRTDCLVCVSTRPSVRGECTWLCVACISHGHGPINKWERGSWETTDGLNTWKEGCRPRKRLRKTESSSNYSSPSSSVLNVDQYVS